MRTVAERETEQAAKRQENVLDWRGIRLALGLRQQELAQLLYVSRQVVSAYERGRCQPSGQTVMILRSWLATPVYRRRLQVAGMAHPFPGDVAATVAEGEAAGSF